MAFRGFVVVSGPPAAGKSSLAPRLAAALDLPLLAKDVIKDALADALGASDLPRSRELGRAVASSTWTAARTAGRGVLEGVWHDYARAPLAARPAGTGRTPRREARAALRARYAARSHSRGAGYFDLDRNPDELWHTEIGTPVAGEWPVLEVDTSGAVDVAALAARIADAGRAL